MGIIYLTAFLTSASQSRPLFGSTGLNPSTGKLSARPTPAFDAMEFIFLMPRADVALETVSWVGTLLSLLLAAGPDACVLWSGLPALLWAMYLSIVNLGARVVIGYGWEWETLEIGFLVIFLGTWFPSRGKFPSWAPPPTLVLWLLRYGTFRLMIGAGMSKLGERSSGCWKDLTCTETHYFTQPMPNMLSWLFHRLPSSAHKAEVALTFFEQLVLPFAVLVPIRAVRIVACGFEVFFQAMIVATGNYAWINWIGALPCLALLDDHALRVFFPEATVDQARKAASRASAPKNTGHIGGAAVRFGRVAMHVFLAVFIACKSAAPLKELFTPAPWLAYYDDYFFVNAQGVFGFINQHRVVLVLEYTHDDLSRLTPAPGPPCKDTDGIIATGSNGVGYRCVDIAPYCDSDPRLKATCPLSCGACHPSKYTWDAPALDLVRWEPLEFKNIPGSPTRRPGFSSPYHYRLDWETWIHTTASMEPLHRQWEAQAQRARANGAAAPLLRMRVPGHVQALAAKVMQGDTDAINLMGTTAENMLAANVSSWPWRLDVPEGARLKPPTAIKAQYYSYEFSSTEALLGRGEWWTRRVMSEALVFEGAAATGQACDTPPVRRSPWHRHWLLAGCTAVLAVCLAAALRPGPLCGTGVLLVGALATTSGVLWAVCCLAGYPNGTWHEELGPLLGGMAAGGLSVAMSTGLLQAWGPSEAYRLVAVVCTACGVGLGTALLAGTGRDRRLGCFLGVQVALMALMAYVALGAAELQALLATMDSGECEA